MSPDRADIFATGRGVVGASSARASRVLVLRESEYDAECVICRIVHDWLFSSSLEEAVCGRFFWGPIHWRRSLSTVFGGAVGIRDSRFIVSFYLLRHRPLHVMGCVLGLAVPLYAFFWFNNAVYGSPLLFGYQTIDTSSAVRALEQSQSVFSSFTLSRVGEVFAHAETILVSFLPYLLPFGFVPHIFWENFLNYFLFMFWWLVLPTGVGICYSLRLGILRVVREKTIDFRLPYIVVTALVSAWLIIFYGSWLFVDNITEEATIGNSYVRYWLPLTILTIPFAAQTLIFVRDRLSGIVRSAVFPLLIAVVVFYGFEATLWGSRESLETAARVLSDYREKALVIERLTPSNAIIFSQRSDKIFFLNVGQHRRLAIFMRSCFFLSW